jgi:putative ABC transport system permease protein
MYFKLAAKNVRKSYRDYVLYFLTLALGVCVFYVFNSIEAQEAMLKISESTHSILQSMTKLMGILSIFVSIVLGFLIVSADQFLIKRRKKEFGIYMTLGMDRGKVARILVAETFLTGVISLAAGLALGVFASQWLSILTARMFEVDMTGYVFIFSSSAFYKTILYFGLIFVVVVLLSAISMSRYRLIDLINADKKNEKPEVKSSAVTILLFVLALVCIVAAYALVIKNGIIEFDGRLIFEIVLGAAGTFLFFASLSGFFLKVLQRNKKRYYRGLNMFVTRQINSRINSTYRSFAVICLLLFFAITIFSFGFGMNATIERSMENDMPYDVILYTDQDINIADTLAQNGVLLEEYTDNYAEHPIYQKDGLVNGSVLGQVEVDNGIVNVNMDSPVALIRLSDYNRQMAMQGKEGIQLQEGQVALQSNNITNVTDALQSFIQEGKTVEVDGKSYSVYPTLLTEGLTVSIGDNVFTMIVPDEVAGNLPVRFKMLYFYCNGDSEAMQAKLSERIKALQGSAGGKAVTKVSSDVALQNTEAFPIMAVTKSETRASYVASKAMIAYVGIYLGIIFLITSAAILALQQLSEMADNRRRYAVLKKIGADDKMTGRAILKQTAIYFLLPLALACVHSVVGLSVINSALASVGSVDAFSSSFITAAIIVVVYGAYFLATYWGSRNLIQKSELTV